MYIPTSLGSSHFALKKKKKKLLFPSFGTVRPGSHSTVYHPGIRSVNSIWYSWEWIQTTFSFVLPALHWFLFLCKLPHLNFSSTLTLDTIVGLHCRLVKGSICWFFMLWLSAWRRKSAWFCRVSYLHPRKSSHSTPSMQALIRNI